MKIKKPKFKPITTTRRTGEATIEISTHQGLKQSLGFQSMDVSYGMRCEVAATPEAIKAAIKMMEQTVEEAIAEKYQDQEKLLKILAKKRAENERQLQQS